MGNYKGPKATTTGVLDTNVADTNVTSSGDVIKNAYEVPAMNVTDTSSFVGAYNTANGQDANAWGNQQVANPRYDMGDGVDDWYNPADWGRDFGATETISNNDLMVQNQSALVDSMGTRNTIAGVGVGLQGVSSLLQYGLGKDALDQQTDIQNRQMAIAEDEYAIDKKNTASYGSAFSNNA